MSQLDRRRAAVNFFSVVAGILAAFALDAGWDSLQAGKEEKRILDVLGTEFRANRVAAEDPLRRHREFVSRAEIYLAEVAASQISADSLTTLLDLAVSGWATYNPATGATQALLTSGEIATLDDFELQRLLTGWTGSLADLAESESRAREMHDAILDFLTLQSPLFFALKRSDRSLVDTTVARDPRVAGLVLRRRLEEGQAVQDTERVVGEIDAILARLATLLGT